MGQSEGKKWVMIGNECGASTQIISHMMGLEPEGAGEGVL